MEATNPSKPLNSEKDWMALISAFFLSDNHYGDSMRGHPFGFPGDQKTPLLVISGTHDKGGSQNDDETNLLLVVDLSPETPRRAPPEDDPSVAQAPAATSNSVFVGKLVFLLVFLVASGLSLQSYMNWAPTEEASTCLEPPEEAPPEVNTTAPVAQVTTPSMLERINHLIQDELSPFVPPSTSKRENNVSFSRLGAMVSRGVTPQMHTAVGAQREGWRPNTFKLLWDVREDERESKVVCCQSWRWVLHRRCRVERTGDETSKRLGAGLIPARRHVQRYLWTRKGRQALAQLHAMEETVATNI
jgi:hypothetical protein